MTSKQLSWAKAFLSGMGLAPTVDATIVAERDTAKIAGDLASVDAQIGQATGERLKGDDKARGKGENVGRGVLNRVGKGFKTDIVENVDAVIKRANALASNGTLNHEIARLVAELTAARDGYEERETGETDPAKLDQRQRKVAAIDSRVEALKSLLHDAEAAQLRAVYQMSDVAKGQALVANPALLAAVLRQDPAETRAVAALTTLATTNPAGLAADLEMFELYRSLQPSGEVLDVTILDAIAASDPGNSRVGAAVKNLAAKRPTDVVAKPAIFGAFVAASEPDDVAKMLENGSTTGADQLIARLVEIKGGDTRYMTSLCGTVVTRETGAQASTGTFFRGNTVATKLTKSLAESGEDSKAYLADLVKLRNQVFGSMSAKTPIEIDTIKSEPGKKMDVDKAVLFITKTCDVILSTLFAKPVPANIATTTAMIADAAVAKGLSQDEQAMMIGGHLLLRLINPLLTQTKKPGDKALEAHEHRLMVLVTKVMQNISNHVFTAREDFMAPLVDYTKAKATALDGWGMTVAQQGRDLLARQS